MLRWPGVGGGGFQMNKSELVQEISSRTKLPSAEVAQVVDAFVRSVQQQVIRGDKVVLSGFGTFHRKSRARRTARNVWTDQPLTVPATNVPAFKPGKPFREAVARRRRTRSKVAAKAAALGAQRRKST
jgi:DNA-binding protein HU-beta